jgi:hypothetical protein
MERIRDSVVKVHCDMLKMSDKKHNFASIGAEPQEQYILNFNKDS